MALLCRNTAALERRACVARLACLQPLFIAQAWDDYTAHAGALYRINTHMTNSIYLHIMERVSYPLFLPIALAALASACSSGTHLAPELEPVAASAIADEKQLPSYFAELEIDTITIVSQRSFTRPRLIRTTLLDFGIRGRCVVRTYESAEVATHLGARNYNETRDLRSPTSVDLLRNRAPSARPATQSNPTFTFGRHVASCAADASVRQAFRRLELYARTID